MQVLVNPAPNPERIEILRGPAVHPGSRRWRRAQLRAMAPVFSVGEPTMRVVAHNPQCDVEQFRRTERFNRERILAGMPPGIAPGEFHIRGCAQKVKDREYARMDRLLPLPPQPNPCPPGAQSYDFGTKKACVYDLGVQTCTDASGQWVCTPNAPGQGPQVSAPSTQRGCPRDCGPYGVCGPDGRCRPRQVGGPNTQRTVAAALRRGAAPTLRATATLKNPFTAAQARVAYR